MARLVPQEPRDASASKSKPERGFGVLQRALTFLFGDDIFISYSRADGITYAAGLGEVLTQRGFSCKLDQWGTQPGKEMPGRLTQALRRSAMLVLVGTPGALHSKNVAEEVHSFRGTGRPIVPILFDGAMPESAVLWQDVEGLPISRDDPATLHSGAPSAAVVNRVTKTFTFTTKEQRLRRSAQVAASVLCVLLGASVGLGAYASWKAAQALKAAAEASRQNDRAVAATKSANEARRVAAEETTKATAASELASKAETRAKEAQAQEALARSQAERQQKIARLRAVSNRVDADLSRDPTVLERSVLVNMEVAKAFHELDVASVEADRGLRASLHLLPRFVAQLPELHGETALSSDGEFFANGWAWNSIFPVTVWNLATGQKVIESDHGSKRVNAAAFGSDAQSRTRYLATACDDTFAGVWDLRTAMKVAWLKHAAPVKVVAFNRDSSLFMTAVADQTVQVWRTTDWTKVADLHPGFDVSALAFSPEGNQLAIAGEKGTVQIWSQNASGWTNGRQLGAQSGISRVLFSPNGKRVLVLNESGNVAARLYECSTSALVGQIQDDIRMGPLSVGADPERFYVALRGNVRTLEWNSGKEGRLTTATGTGGSFVSADGKYFGLLADRVFSAKIQDTQTAETVATVIHPADPLHLKGIYSYIGDVQAAGRHVLTLTSLRYSIWENPDSLPDRHYRHDHRVLWTSLVADGKLLGTGSVDGRVNIWDTRSGEQLFSFMTPNDPIIGPDIRHVEFHPAGDLFAVVNWSDIFVVRRSTANVVAKLHFFEVYSLAFSPDGRYLAAGGSDGLVLWSIDTWQPVSVGSKAGHTILVKFSPQGNFVATVTSQGDRSTVWRTKTGELVRDFKFDRLRASTVAFSADEQSLAIGIGTLAVQSEGGTVVVRNIATGADLLQVRHGPPAPSAIAFTPDGLHLITASGDNTATVKVWRLPDGKEVASLDHAKGVNTIAFTADGRRLVTGGKDPTTKVWDTRGWHEIARLESDPQLFFVSLSVAGNLVSAVSTDRSARVFTLDLADLLASACSRVSRELTSDEWTMYFGAEAPRTACPERH